MTIKYEESEVYQDLDTSILGYQIGILDDSNSTVPRLIEINGRKDYFLKTRDDAINFINKYSNELEKDWLKLIPLKNIKNLSEIDNNTIEVKGTIDSIINN